MLGKAHLLLAAILLLAPGAAAGGEPEPREGQDSGSKALRGAAEYASLEVSPQSVRSIVRALDFLAKQQGKDGSFGSNGQHRAAMPTIELAERITARATALLAKWERERDPLSG